MTAGKGSLQRKTVVDDKYTIQFFIKQGSHAETYRVKDRDGRTLFLKLFVLNKLHATQFDGADNIKEIEFLKTVQHPNITQYADSGKVAIAGQEYVYLVLQFISGETLAERLKRKRVLSAHELKKVIPGILQGLDHLHRKERPIVHNDINHHNIMIELGDNSHTPKIIDFGYARYFHNSTKVYYREGLDPYFLAPECFENVFSPQSDIFSVGALIYRLLFGMPPWSIDQPTYAQEQADLETQIINARRRPLRLPALDDATQTGANKWLPILSKALQEKPEDRFASAAEMLQAVKGELEVALTPVVNTISAAGAGEEKGGFDQIAGMAALKETLYQDVVRALEDKDLYAEYGLTIPNGILLYGPPGCGKSFFAEKLAEEAKYNFVTVQPSDLASIYVHGSQEKIGQLFAEARTNAPTILNFEEFDALVPKRESQHGAKQSGEVNEFLTQLNNCGQSGVFVIATTNRPQLIDQAVLRTGRIDKIFYVPPPDHNARKEMFEMLLESRPSDPDIDYNVLADRTEGYVMIDIKHMVDEAARAALRERSKITQQVIENIISTTRASVTAEDLKKYEENRSLYEKDYQGNKRTIGFRRNT